MTDLLEKVMGPAAAAPETPFVRGLRLTFIAFATATTCGVAGFGALLSLDRWFAGVVMFVIVALTGVLGIWYFSLKMRRDNAFADRRLIDARSAEGLASDKGMVQ